jgi:hypothetical protein
VDRIITIGRCQWQAFWRRFKRAGHLNAGNQALLLILSVLVLIRFVRSLHIAAMDLPQGKSLGFESLLLVIFLVWMFPLANTARIVNSTAKLLHLPLTLRELFTIRLITLMIPPYAWIILGGSLAICYPIVRAPNPLAGVMAALLFIMFSAFTGLTISQLLRMSFWRKLFFGVLLSSGLLVFFLIPKPGRESLLSLLSAGPASLVTRAALGKQSWLAVGELALLATIALLAALWSFKKSLQVTPGTRSQKIAMFNWLRIPGPAGGLAAKDFRYFRRLLDPYLGVLAAVFSCFYLVTADVPSAGVFQVLLLAVIIPNSALAFNLFGLDNRSEMERLRLMPVSGKTILLAKNLAFLMIVGVQVMPLVLLGCWRLGPLIGAMGLVEAMSMTAMFLVWGNWTSVNQPFKMHFFQFSSSNGQVVEAIGGLIFGSLPGMIAIYLLHSEGPVATWKIALILLCCAGLYLVSVSYLGNRFAQKQDRILNALS